MHHDPIAPSLGQQLDYFDALPYGLSPNQGDDEEPSAPPLPLDASHGQPPTNSSSGAAAAHAHAPPPPPARTGGTGGRAALPPRPPSASGSSSGGGSSSSAGGSRPRSPPQPPRSAPQPAPAVGRSVSRLARSSFVGRDADGEPWHNATSSDAEGGSAGLDAPAAPFAGLLGPGNDEQERSAPRDQEREGGGEARAGRVVDVLSMTSLASWNSQAAPERADSGQTDSTVHFSDQQGTSWAAGSPAGAAPPRFDDSARRSAGRFAPEQQQQQQQQQHRRGQRRASSEGGGPQDPFDGPEESAADGLPQGARPWAVAASHPAQAQQQQRGAERVWMRSDAPHLGLDQTMEVAAAESGRITDLATSSRVGSDAASMGAAAATFKEGGAPDAVLLAQGAPARDSPFASVEQPSGREGSAGGGGGALQQQPLASPAAASSPTAEQRWPPPAASGVPTAPNSTSLGALPSLRGQTPRQSATQDSPPHQDHGPPTRATPPHLASSLPGPASPQPSGAVGRLGSDSTTSPGHAPSLPSQGGSSAYAASASPRTMAAIAALGAGAATATTASAAAGAFRGAGSSVLFGDDDLVRTGGSRGTFYSASSSALQQHLGGVATPSCDSDMSTAVCAAGAAVLAQQQQQHHQQQQQASPFLLRVGTALEAPQRAPAVGSPASLPPADDEGVLMGTVDPASASFPTLDPSLLLPLPGDEPARFMAAAAVGSARRRSSVSGGAASSSAGAAPHAGAVPGLQRLPSSSSAAARGSREQQQQSPRVPTGMQRQGSSRLSRHSSAGSQQLQQGATGTLGLQTFPPGDDEGVLMGTVEGGSAFPTLPASMLAPLPGDNPARFAAL